MTIAVLASSQASAQSPTPSVRGPLARAESLYATTRTLKDRLDIATLRGLRMLAAVLRPQYLASRAELKTELAIDSAGLRDSIDRRALGVMRRTLASDLTDAPAPPGGGPRAAAPVCDFDPRTMTNTDSLQARLYACYSLATKTITVDAETLGRLTVLGRLGREPDAAKRRRLFSGLDHVWRAVNGDDDSLSPYRELLRRRAAEWHGTTPFQRGVRALGLSPDTVEQWLVRLLQSWRATLPDSAVEPWDLYYVMGGAARRLAARIPRDSLVAISNHYYRSLGADPVRLNIHYDIDPRPGKTPVAFTTFGARPPGEPWIFATYAEGGLDNLGELLHETGHGIHIAAIRTRPAFSDWPDADLFTEAIADLADAAAYAGRWQLRYLGDSASLGDNQRALFFGVMMDACWSLFEARTERDPSLDPNAVWADLTSRYLGAVPHSELSWWAMRGQLIDLPGYLVNYALGAFIVADLRERIRAVHGDYTLGDATWYAFVSERIYRFGLERSSQRVMEDFLGRSLAPDALLRELRR